MRTSDSKNEKVWLRKVETIDPKKWQGLTQKSGKNSPKKMKRSDSEKWEGFTKKMRFDSETEKV